MSQKTLSRFLLLPELELLKIFRIGKFGIGLSAKKTSLFEVCPKCATPSSSIYDRRSVKIRDEPVRGQAVVLFLSKRRFQCKKCAKPFTEPIPGISKGKRTTERFRRGLCWASETFVDLSLVQKAYQCSAGLVYQATYEQLDLRQRSRTYPLPSSIGIDEHSLRKPKFGATEFSTIIVDHKNHRVFDLIDGRSRPELFASFSRIKGSENVRIVTMDLSPTFRSFSKSQFPNAAIVADRFHVQRLFTKQVNRMRKRVTGDKRKNPIRKLLLRNQSELTPEERFAVKEWLNYYPDLREMYEYKEAMRRVYMTKGYRRAETSLKNLLDRMGKSRLNEAQKIRRTLLSWRREILAYHLFNRISNGRVEGFNRKAKLCQRRAFGYRKFENYRLRLLNMCR